jgi:hypothetical protein
VLAAKEKMEATFDCDNIGELTEYIGCKIYRMEDYVKSTQPVLLQSFVDEFNTERGQLARTPAETGKVFVKVEIRIERKSSEKTKYICEVGKFLHMMRCFRPEIKHSVRELPRFMTSGTTPSNVKALRGVMEYWISTEKTRHYVENQIENGMEIQNLN